MEKDLFEDQLNQKRDAFDHLNPPTQLWDAIAEQSFGKKKHRSSTIYWQIAASVLLLTTIGLGIMLYQQPVAPQSLGDLSPVYEQMEKDYQTEIQKIYTQLPLDSISHSDYKCLLDELAYLDTVRADYLKDLPKVQNREKVIRALVDYYEKKLKILHKLELEINRQQHEKEFAIS